MLSHIGRIILVWRGQDSQRAEVGGFNSRISAKLQCLSLDARETQQYSSVNTRQEHWTCTRYPR